MILGPKDSMCQDPSRSPRKPHLWQKPVTNIWETRVVREEESKKEQREIRRG